MSKVITMGKFNDSDVMEKCKRLEYGESYVGTLYRVEVDDNNNIIKILDESPVHLVHTDNKVKNLLNNNISNDQYYAKGQAFYLLVEGCKKTKKLEQQRNRKYLELQQQRLLVDRSNKFIQVQNLLPNATEQQLDEIISILENN